MVALLRWLKGALVKPPAEFQGLQAETCRLQAVSTTSCMYLVVFNS